MPGVSCRIVALALTLLLCLQLQSQTRYYMASQGTIQFRSEAPQELVKATSKELQGALEPAGKTFSFKVRVASFTGFNSAMQETHFHENYMETSRYPEAYFKGKIIEEMNWEQPGKYTVRAKGKLTIHGGEQERIIKADISILPDRNIRIESVFTVLLTDHNIPVPRIVKEKLAEEIKVAVSARLEPHN